MAELLPSNCLPILETFVFSKVAPATTVQFPSISSAWEQNCLNPNKKNARKDPNRCKFLTSKSHEISRTNNHQNSDQMCKLSAEYEDYTLTFIGNSSGIPFVFFLANDKYIHIYIYNIILYIYIYISPLQECFESLETGWLSPFLHRTAKLNKI